MIYSRIGVLLCAAALMGCASASEWGAAPKTHFDLQPYGVNVSHIQRSAEDFDIMSLPDSFWAGTGQIEVVARAPVLAGMKQMATTLCNGRPYEVTDQQFSGLTLFARVRCGK